MPLSAQAFTEEDKEKDETSVSGRLIKGCQGY
jgi:hypothetical protein